MEKHRITLERTYRASVEEIWGLWTTKDGFESWWGPEGFIVQVRKLELRAGGELLYAMIADAPEEIAFMKKAGMPVSTEGRMIFRDVSPMRRLSYTHLIDFVPEVEAYDVETVVEFHASKGEVRMVLSLDPMHSEEWTRRAVAGMASQLSKLDTRFKKAEGL